MFFCKKDPLFNNHKVQIIKTTSHSLVDFYNPFTGINFRDYNPIKYCLETDSLIGCKNLIKNKSKITPKHYYDSEEVLEYRDVVLFKLACQKYSKGIYNKNKYRVRNVLIDKTFNCLIVFDSIDDMFNYISGKNFNYNYGASLNSFINLTLCKKKVINNIDLEISKNSKPKLLECTLIENDCDDLIKRKFCNHFNNFIKINKLFKFSSVYPNKIKIFKETIENIVGYKIIYDD